MTVQFTEPALLDVTVAGYAGSGCEGKIELLLVRRTGEGSGREYLDSAQPGADDRASFKAVEPGECEVHIQVGMGGREGGSAPAAVEAVGLRPGRNQATVSIPPLYSVAIHVGRPGRLFLGPSVRESDRDWGVEVPVDPEGRAVIERLAAGTYTLGFAERGDRPAAEMTLRVPGPAEVAFEPEPRDALFVRVTDGAGYLARAGFADGDLVIGAGGAEFERAPSLDLLRLAAATRDLDLTVLRGAQVLTIRTDIDRLASGGGLGGFLRPASRH